LFGCRDVCPTGIQDGKGRSSSEFHISCKTGRLEVGSEVIACFRDRNIGKEGGGISSLVIENDFVISVGSGFEVYCGFWTSEVIRRLTVGSSWLDVSIYDEIFIFKDIKSTIIWSHDSF
jgi:hypothetical protein